MSAQLGQSIHFRPTRTLANRIRELAEKERITQAELMRRVMDEYFSDGAKATPITIQSALGDGEELSLALGLYHQCREHWRDVRSRINMVRPIRPDDEAEMKEWRKQKEQVATYFSACEDMKKRLEKLSEFYSGFTTNDYENLKKLGELTLKAKISLEQKNEIETDANKIRNLDTNIIYFEIVLKWLRALGIINV